MNSAKELFGGRRGKDVVRRTGLMLGIGMGGANVIGALIVYAIVAWLVPTPPLTDTDAIERANFILLVAYLVVAVPVGMLWGLALLQPARRWLLAERTPTETEQRITLTTPARLLVVQGTLWLVGGALFVLFNLQYSARLSMVIAIAALLAGMSTSTFGYLLAERVGREAFRLALANGAPLRPVAPGVMVRTLFAWALSTGVPLLGLALIGGGVVLGIIPATADRLAVSALFLGTEALIVGLLAMALAGRSVADPIVSVRRALDRVRAGDTDAHVDAYDGSEIGMLQAGFNEMVAGLRERERLQDIFGRHVGEDVARQALEQGVVLGGEVRDVAALFVDVVGSTELASRVAPQEVVRMLNRFFDVVVAVVREHDGSVNKFVGDAALCVFGAPEALPDATGRALAAARELHARIASDLTELSAGIGVSSGRAVAGNIGTAERFEYTVIGDPVNEAARLTELAKKRGGILASGDAVAAASSAEASKWRLEESVVLRGREQPTRLALPQND
jgi:adenylate cyclase